MKFCFLFSLLILSIGIISAQNLIQNGLFESNQAWRANKKCFAFKYSQENKEAQKSYKPKSGNGMIQMNYVSRCNCTGFKENATFEGCSSYLSQKMAQPLQIGETYAITYWVFLPKIYSDPLEPNITKNIGVTTSYYPLQDDKSDCLLPLNTLKADSLLSFNAWHKLTWYIKPTCIQNYFFEGYTFFRKKR